MFSFLGSLLSSTTRVILCCKYHVNSSTSLVEYPQSGAICYYFIAQAPQRSSRNVDAILYSRTHVMITVILEMVDYMSANSSPAVLLNYHL